MLSEQDNAEYTLEDRIEYTRKMLAALEAEKKLVDAKWQKLYEKGNSYWCHENFPGAKFFDIEAAQHVNELLIKSERSVSALASLVSGADLKSSAHNVLEALREHSKENVMIEVSADRFLYLAEVISGDDDAAE